MDFVGEGQDELKIAAELCNHCKSSSPLPLGIWVLSEQQLAEMPYIGNILQLQLSATVLQALTHDPDVRLRHLAHHPLGMIARAGAMGKTA